MNMVFSSDNPSVLATDIINSAAAMGVTSVPYIYNAYQEYRTNRAIIGIIKVFTFGFIALISCIATANVLNTISTNINLRRREFAILRSVGMTDKGMHRMMMYECMMYGIKSVAAGVPAGILISFGIYKVISFGYSGQYIFPAQGIIISVLSVFAVVFITMLYSSGKVLKENTLQALKNENI